MATPGKKTVKKPKAKKVRATSRAGSAKKTAKKRAKASAKKAKKAARKTPPAKKAAKKTKRSSKKTAKKIETTRPRSAARKAGKGAKAGAAKAPRSETSSRNSFYITTAIAYPNGVPHIGHAYEAIATDALARFQRLDGRDVFFLTGTDEHGLKMIQTAEAEKLPTMEVATRNAQRFKEMDQRLDVSFDRFIRTTEEQHHRSSQEIWKRMADNGDIYLDS